MTGRTPRQALDSFLSPLQRALSCVTDAVLHCNSPANAGSHGTAALRRQTRLKATSETLYLSVMLNFRIVDESGTRGPCPVTTTTYYYSLLDSDEKEIIAYHWHPDRDVVFPHLHICAVGRIGRADLRKAHIPTGRIVLADVLRMAITEFDVVPRRNDWRDVLTGGQVA